MWVIAHNKFFHHVRILNYKVESDRSTPVMHHNDAFLVAQSNYELLHRKKQKKTFQFA